MHSYGFHFQLPLFCMLFLFWSATGLANKQVEAQLKAPAVDVCTQQADRNRLIGTTRNSSILSCRQKIALQNSCNAQADARKLAAAARTRFLHNCLAVRATPAPIRAPALPVKPASKPPIVAQPVPSKDQLCAQRATQQRLSGTARTTFIRSCMSGASVAPAQMQARPLETKAPSTTPPQIRAPSQGAAPSTAPGTRSPVSVRTQGMTVTGLLDRSSAAISIRTQGMTVTGLLDRSSASKSIRTQGMTVTGTGAAQ